MAKGSEPITFKAHGDPPRVCSECGRKVRLTDVTEFRTMNQGRRLDPVELTCVTCFPRRK